MSPVLLIGFLVLAIVFVLYWIGAFLIMYHLIRFGIGAEPKKAVLIFFMGSIILSFIAAICLGFAAFSGSVQLEKIQQRIPEGGILNLDEFRLYVAPPATTTPQ